MRFYDMNEGAFAYHRHCLGSTGAINPTFLKMFEFVADEFLTESIKDNPNMKPEKIQSKILERRYKIQYGLDRANMRDGCSSMASMRSKDHYQNFSNYTLSEIRAFIDESTAP